MEALIAEAEQFVWGGTEAAEVPALLSRLQETRAWVGALNAAMKSKLTLKALEPLLAWDPPPVSHPGPSPLRHLLWLMSRLKPTVRTPNINPLHPAMM